MTTRPQPVGAALATLGLCLFAASPALAILDFDYEVERFQVVGNLPGNLSDEFDDGSLGGWFVTPGGNVSETGGALHLMGPGFEDADSYADLNPNIILNRSDAFAPAAFGVTDGSGNFTATSQWRTLPDDPAGFYSMGVRQFTSSTLVEGISLSISNHDAATAAAFGGLEGLSVSFGKFSFDVTSQSLISIESQRLALDPNDVTGDLLLQLLFDDATNEFTAALSLDGGLTTENLFDARDLSLRDAFGTANFFLFGDPPTVVPEPNTALLLGLGLVGVARRPRAR